jgi:hypothetical protein
MSKSKQNPHLIYTAGIEGETIADAILNIKGTQTTENISDALEELELPLSPEAIAEILKIIAKKEDSDLTYEDIVACAKDDRIKTLQESVVTTKKDDEISSSIISPIFQEEDDDIIIDKSTISRKKEIPISTKFTIETDEKKQKPDKSINININKKDTVNALKWGFGKIKEIKRIKNIASHNSSTDAVITEIAGRLGYGVAFKKNNKKDVGEIFGKEGSPKDPKDVTNDDLIEKLMEKLQVRGGRASDDGTPNANPKKPRFRMNKTEAKIQETIFGLAKALHEQAPDKDASDTLFEESTLTTRKDLFDAMFWHVPETKSEKKTYSDDKTPISDAKTLKISSKTHPTDEIAQGLTPEGHINRLFKLVGNDFKAIFRNADASSSTAGYKHTPSSTKPLPTTKKLIEKEYLNTFGFGGLHGEDNELLSVALRLNKELESKNLQSILEESHNDNDIKTAIKNLTEQEIAFTSGGIIVALKVDDIPDYILIEQNKISASSQRKYLKALESSISSPSYPIFIPNELSEETKTNVENFIKSELQKDRVFSSYGDDLATYFRPFSGDDIKNAAIAKPDRHLFCHKDQGIFVKIKISSRKTEHFLITGDDSNGFKLKQTSEEDFNEFRDDADNHTVPPRLFSSLPQNCEEDLAVINKTFPALKDTTIQSRGFGLDSTGHVKEMIYHIGWKDSSNAKKDDYVGIRHNEDGTLACTEYDYTSGKQAFEKTLHLPETLVDNANAVKKFNPKVIDEKTVGIVSAFPYSGDPYLNPERTKKICFSRIKDTEGNMIKDQNYIIDISSGQMKFQELKTISNYQDATEAIQTAVKNGGLTPDDENDNDRIDTLVLNEGSFLNPNNSRETIFTRGVITLDNGKKEERFYQLKATPDSLVVTEISQETFRNVFPLYLPQELEKIPDIFKICKNMNVKPAAAVTANGTLFCYTGKKTPEKDGSITDDDKHFHAVTINGNDFSIKESSANKYAEALKKRLPDDPEQIDAEQEQQQFKKFYPDGNILSKKTPQANDPYVLYEAKTSASAEPAYFSYKIDAEKTYFSYIKIDKKAYEAAKDDDFTYVETEAKKQLNKRNSTESLSK